MPLNQKPLELAPEPQSVHVARHWVRERFGVLEREDLLECAELATSELVTNALLHASDPISIRLRGTREHPRVEVGDGSTEPPQLPGPPSKDLDDLLATFGRGLEIVARCSVAWGATIEREGKVVWFEPAPEPHEDAAPPAAIYDESDRRHEPVTGRRLTVHLRNMPVGNPAGPAPAHTRTCAANCACSPSPTRRATHWRPRSPSCSRSSTPTGPRRCGPPPTAPPLTASR